MMKLINTLKTLLLLSAFAFVGINTSSAMYQYYQIGLDSIPSDWNNQYDITFLKKGVFNTNYLGTVKPLIALNNQYMLFWNQYGLYLYNYINSNKFGVVQGYFQYVYSCDEITESGDGISNCSSAQNVLGSDEVSVNFLKTLNQGDWVYIYDENANHGCGGYCTYDRYRITVCFSSQSISKTLCFAGDVSTYPGHDYYGPQTPFTGSMQLGNNINFGNINRGILYNPPGFIAGGSDGTGSTISPGVVVGMCPTIGELIESEESTYGYSSSLCYSPTKIISIEGQPTISEVPSQSIFELYPTYTGFVEDLSLYNSCMSSTSERCSVPFSGKLINFWLLNNYVKSVSNSRHQTFYNYCNAVINLDPNSTTCTNSTGSIVLPGTEYNSQEEMIEKLVSNMNIYNYYNYNWGGSGENESGFDFNSLSESWSGVNELFTSFNYREGVNGILPKYIVIGFLGILLLYVFKR